MLSTLGRSISAGGFDFREREVALRQRNPRHSHDYHCIGFLIQGLGSAEFGREYWTVRPGTLNVIPGGIPHVESFGTPRIRWCAIEVPELRDEFAQEARRAFERPMQVLGGPARTLAARIYRELCLDDATSALSLHGLGYELLAALARGRTAEAASGHPAWLPRAEEYLRANCLEAFTLDELAAEAGVHPTHLARVFRRRFGASVGEYVRGLRIEHACVLLRRDGLALSEIARAVGFADQAHFTRVFKRHVGTTPGAYRLGLRAS